MKEERPEQAKLEELRGYTGKPIYSREHVLSQSAHRRSRIIAQWADPESKIKEAIKACPVDCISMVERSELAPLEFLMSKQPRGSVRIGVGNTVGERVSNVFVDAKKFQERYEAMSRTTRESSQETDLQRDVRISAVEAIRKTVDPDIRKLQDAVAAMKQAEQSGKAKEKRPASMVGEDYWIPSNQALPSPVNNSSSKATSNPLQEEIFDETDHHFEDTYRASELKDHIGGSLALSIVNSPWQQILLAGVTWYFIGAMLLQLVEAIQSKQEDEGA
ncbi:unnamed protein product [Thlaspi arvense]|uniref:Uncharacterized protein n=1 Tax=Thlaspi arvense TaxID=13288 RepID=A0AAU9SRJ9_THLAR|nr:unnamed protein product [Thlaspi arvense]